MRIFFAFLLSLFIEVNTSTPTEPPPASLSVGVLRRKSWRGGHKLIIKPA